MSTDENKKDENVDTGFLDSIDGVLDTILAAFSVPEEPVTPLPPPLIMIGGKIRTGISKKSIISNVIARQSEAGLPTGKVFADGPNSNEIMIKVIVEEIVNSLLNECVVNLVIDPLIPVMVVGANGGGPMVSMGYTTLYGSGNGIIR
jgi:hypothetical protein